MIVVLGDLTAVDRAPARDAVVLAVPGASLGEITARQVPQLAGCQATCVVVCPGPADLLAGYDESRIHADLVALCDALVPAVSSPESVVFRAFAPVPGRQADGRLIDAAARVTCELRGIEWHVRDDVAEFTRGAGRAGPAPPR